MQPSLLKLHRECETGGGLALAGADDTYAVGPPEVVFPAILRYAEEIWERCSLQLQWRKTVVYCGDRELPVDTPPGISLAGEKVGENFLPGLMVYGVPVGSPAYITFKLREKAKVIVEDAEKIKKALASDRQGLWSALRLSLVARFGYLQQHVEPSLCEPVARELDEALWKILEAACGFDIPRGAEQGGLCLQIPEIAALDGSSYQEAVIRLPARLYGWGLRSLQENCAPAFLGTLETVLPFMGGPGGICTQLEVLWGGLECWGEEAGKEDRWRRVIASNSSIGREVTKAWGKIRLEAAQAAAWLGEEVPKALGCTFLAIGDGSDWGDEGQAGGGQGEPEGQGVDEGPRRSQAKEHPGGLGLDAEGSSFLGMGSRPARPRHSTLQCRVFGGCCKQPLPSLPGMQGQGGGDNQGGNHHRQVR